jgi:hypothetical protein
MTASTAQVERLQRERAWADDVAIEAGHDALDLRGDKKFVLDDQDGELAHGNPAIGHRYPAVGFAVEALACRLFLAPQWFHASPQASIANEALQPRFLAD